MLRTPRLFLWDYMDLLSRAKGWAAGPSRESSHRGARHPEERQTRPRKALNNWRVILDKLHMVVVLASLQEGVESWCGSFPPLGPSIEQSKEETLQDVYGAILAAGARTLPSLKSKTPPSVPASDCTHPKAQLKGGGNATSSFIVCKACHSRWECPERATVLRAGRVMPHWGIWNRGRNREVSRAGRRAQEVMPEHSQGLGTAQTVVQALRRQMEEQSVQLQKQMAELQRKSEEEANQGSARLNHMGLEVRQVLDVLQERERDREILMQEALLKMQNLEAVDRRSLSPTPVTPPSSTRRGTSAWRKEIPGCHCGENAVLREHQGAGIQQGRQYWRCCMKACDFHQWVETEKEIPRLARPRSKSPRRSTLDTPTTWRDATVVSIPSDGEEAHGRR